MAYFKTIYCRGAYFLPVRNLVDDDIAIAMRFDTGAIKTVISVASLVRNTIDYKSLAEKVEALGVQSRVFKSATGNEMKGYLVCAEKVNISKHILNKFFYYLIVDTDERLGLIGDDFISKCRFTHEIDGQIVIDDFDETKYEQNVDNFISENEISRLLEVWGTEKQ